MKTTPFTTLAASLLLAAGAHAQITGINSVSSSAAIQFDDTASFDPSLFPGITNITPTVSPWTGATHSLPFTTDIVTLDTAQGDVTATFAGNSYAINFANVLLNQAILNTGFAQLVFTFAIEYQLGGAGLPSQATLFPSFSVNGTVQTGGFAFVSGFINYDAVNTAGTISTVETVNYNQLFSTPGGFLATVPGVPNNGTTPALVANTTLTLSGSITFLVDPAEIHAESQMVPEPTAGVLVLLASLPMLLRRRRA